MINCIKCNIDKELTDFHKRGNGFRKECKTCMNEYHKKYLQEMDEEKRKLIVERKKKWDENNRKKRQDYGKEYYKNNIENIKQYYKNNSEHKAEYNKKTNAINNKYNDNHVIGFISIPRKFCFCHHL